MAKILDAHFIAGTLIKGGGVVGLIVGIALLIPPVEYIGLAILLVVLGIVALHFGNVVARNAPPSASRITVDTLRKAGLLDRKNKKQK